MSGIVMPSPAPIGEVDEDVGGEVAVVEDAVAAIDAGPVAVLLIRAAEHAEHAHASGRQELQQRAAQVTYHEFRANHTFLSPGCHGPPNARIAAATATRIVTG